MEQVRSFVTEQITYHKKQFVAGRVKEIYAPVLDAIHAKQPDTCITLKTLKGCRIAVNGNAAAQNTALHPGDIVYLFPAVAGG